MKEVDHCRKCASRASSKLASGGVGISYKVEDLKVTTMKEG